MFWQQILNGLTLGSAYILIALGLTMVYGILNLLHFAHGTVYMVGAFSSMVAIIYLKLPFPLAFLLAMVLAGLVGILIERIAYRPLRNAHPINILISGIGITIILENLFRLFFGAQTRPFPNVNLSSKTYGLGNGLSITNFQIYILVTAVVLVGLLQILIKRTKVGTALVATSQDMKAAKLMGIDINRMVALTFFLGSALAAAAGTLVALYFNAIYPTMGSMPGLKAFSVVVLGGLGSIPGTIIGGLFLGVIESLGAGYVQTVIDANAIAFVILILVLLIKPTGLFGKKIEKV
ncbi:branched-chain amino acid ABC transporter permease [Desulfosporosinus sp. OT]|uniref:branched-chain amino acid ABC transporter permease n=1 Tax=Desulfosporosinus sp. OT TaxID=913865 RepID=UPI000223A196|nr:branched-chain amino acid ABC transporter permease [Desulfosporosinus sp. OT]EGW38506.1 branched-chain amino acid transport system / permease component family protein [Desulfosporosinus sp. OT]